PLSFPALYEFLQECKIKRLVPNITINEIHAISQRKLLDNLQKFGIIYGVGISIHKEIKNAGQFVGIKNLVYHVIAGVNNIEDVIRAKLGKILVLGYKEYGFGIKYYSKEVGARINKWKYWLPSLIRQNHVSFDNLGIKQLGVQSLLRK